MWLTWLGFVAQQAADVERFSGTWLLIGLRGAPLVFFLWAALTDSMRLFIWFELVLLFYFISAVEAAFAYQADIVVDRRSGACGDQLHCVHALHPLSGSGTARRPLTQAKSWQ